MDEEWLAERLAEGMSIEAIARDAGKGASTVAYWIDKHGLTPAGAGRHAARGPIDRAVLRELVERGHSVREIATELDRSPKAVRHRLHRHELRTGRACSSWGRQASDRRPRLAGFTGR